MQDKRLDMEKIAQGLDAQRVGKVHSLGGYFGAMQLAAEVEEELVLQRDRLAEMLAELAREHGPLDPAHMEEARQAWPAPKEHAAKRRGA